MFSQDGRQQMPGMHTGRPIQGQVQVSNIGQQMQQVPTGMQMGLGHQQQQPMGGMQGSSVTLQGMQKSLGTIGPHHSLNTPSTTQQMGMGGGIRPMNVGGPQQQPIVVKSEIGGPVQVPGPGIQMQGQRMQAPNQQVQMQEGPTAASQQQALQQQALQQDRIVKFKQLLPQLKECLINLISVARQNFAANATIDNLEKSADTSSLPRFDKALEQFYSICNQIEVNLCLANDQISHTLYSIQYTPLNQNQMKDTDDMQGSTNYINTVKQQLAYAKNIQAMLVESSNKVLTRQERSQQQPIGERQF